MAQAHQELRKRALADVSNSRCRPLKAGRPEPLEDGSADVAASQPVMVVLKAQHGLDLAAAGGLPAAAAAPEGSAAAASDEPSSPTSDSDASCDTECDSPAPSEALDRSSTSPPPSQAEQQSAYLLLKACEREEAESERADAAELALAESNRKLAATEAALAAAQERLQLLEVQLLNRAVAAAKLDAGRPGDASLPQAPCSESLSDASDDTGADASDMAVQAGEDWPRASFDWDSAQVDSESVQLRLELEATNARLCMSREAEQKAVAYAEVASVRMEAFCHMLRGTADIAFAGTDCSARRLRHHLFRCLDVDCDGFLGGGDLQHWYRVSEQFLDTQGYDPVELEALQAQLADALYNPSLPEEFQCKGKVSLMQLSRSKMGGGIIATLLNLDNLMQDRNTSEWGSQRAVPLS